LFTKFNIDEEDIQEFEKKINTVSHSDDNIHCNLIDKLFKIQNYETYDKALKRIHTQHYYYLNDEGEECLY
jgi:hypothetical protein